jgi:hypothetical protein
VTNQTEKAAAADERGNPEMVGHGSKFGRKKEAAIAALLTQLTAPDEGDCDARK